MNVTKLLLYYPLVIAGLAALVGKLRPGWPRRRVIAGITLPAPLAVLAAAAWSIAALGPAPRGEIDATGMALAVYVIGGLVLAAALLVLGLGAAWLVLRSRGLKGSPRPGAPADGAAGGQHPSTAELSSHDPLTPDFAALLAPLPESAQAELRRRTRASVLPATPAELFREVHGWLVGAGISEGRGGYSGGRGKSGWVDYVEDQRRSVAVFRAVADAWGEPPAGLAASIDGYDRSFPPPQRLLGDGWQPHVSDVAGRLIYEFPVASGHATGSFAFPIAQSDLDVLLIDPYRRAVLEVVTHTVFQRSIIRGNPEVTEAEFHRIVAKVLHTPFDELKTYLVAFAQEYNMGVDCYVQQAIKSQTQQGSVVNTPS